MVPLLLRHLWRLIWGKNSLRYVTFSFHYTSAVPYLCEKFAQNILFIRMCTLIIHTGKTITMYSFYRGRTLASQPKLHHGTKQFVSKSGIDITNLQHFFCAFPINLTKNPDAQLKPLLTLPLSFAFTSGFLVTQIFSAQT